jgi:hypothetical protein
VQPRVPEWDGLSLIPLASLVVAPRWMCYAWVETESGQDPRVRGGLGEVMAWLGVGYIDTVSGSIVRVVTACYLCRCINPFEWSCLRYRTGYGVDITTRILALFELVTGEMNLESLMFVTFLLHSLLHYLST